MFLACPWAAPSLLITPTPAITSVVCLCGLKASCLYGAGGCLCGVGDCVWWWGSVSVCGGLVSVEMVCISLWQVLSVV